MWGFFFWASSLSSARRHPSHRTIEIAVACVCECNEAAFNIRHPLTIHLTDFKTNSGFDFVTETSTLSVFQTTLEWYGTMYGWLRRMSEKHLHASFWVHFRHLHICKFSVVKIYPWQLKWWLTFCLKSFNYVSNSVIGGVGKRRKTRVFEFVCLLLISILDVKFNV